MNQKVVVVFIEGDTEEEFYAQILQELRKKAGGKFQCKIEVKNVKGVGQYQKKVSRIFEKKLLKQFPDAEFEIFLSYDTDVFELNQKPPVNWDEVTNKLLLLGANSVHQIKAKRSIEDWILYDIEGVRNFVKLPQKTKLSGYKGTVGLQQIFKKASKTYVKGNSSNGLVKALHFDIIFPQICSEICELCNALNVSCNSNNKLCK